eukprot:3878484-Rhodomonas_salina.2
MRCAVLTWRMVRPESGSHEGSADQGTRVSGVCSAKCGSDIERVCRRKATADIPTSCTQGLTRTLSATGAWRAGSSSEKRCAIQRTRAAGG